MATSIALLFGFAVIAFSLSAACGGGAGLLLLPLLGLVLPAAQVPAALSIGTASSALSRMGLFRTQIRWDITAWFVPAALPAVWLGAYLLSTIHPMYLELLMGLFLLANLPMLFAQHPHHIEHTPISKTTLVIVGAATGFLSGLTGAVGLLFNRFYLRHGLTKEQVIATRAANELLLHLIKLVLYTSFGLLTSKVIILGVAIALAALLASWGMKWWLPKLTENLFRRIGYGAMVAAGMMMFVDASHQIKQEHAIEIDHQLMPKGGQTMIQWKLGAAAFEYKYDEGFEFERTISLLHLPLDKQAKVHALTAHAQEYTLEEVFGVGKHYYELYVTQGGVLSKHSNL